MKLLVTDYDGTMYYEKQDLRTLSVLNPELQINGIELDKKKNKDKQIEYDD